MITRTISGTIQGVEVESVDIEADCSDIEPNASEPRRFSVIGLPDAAVRESRDRVRSALFMNHLPLPRGNITVNLAPAGLRKTGALYDLPIALCLCAFKNIFPAEALDNTLVVGELSLNGEVRSIAGALPLAMHAQSLGFKRVLVPKANALEAATVQGIDVYGIGNLRDAIQLFNDPQSFPATRVDVESIFSNALRNSLDFVDVKGQDSAKRALVIAAAGNHNLLMVGSPGVGKSLIANRIPSIMPPLSFEESLEVTRLYSIAGLLPQETGLIVNRPFRSPHHTVSDAGLMGGGSGIPRPGEITLAHRGVLFLDELPEFRRNVLEALRQPIENGNVVVARAAGSFNFPSRFMLVAAMNPCPCGYYGTSGGRCHCHPIQVQNYRSRISGPLMDRVDLHIEVPPLPEEVLTSGHNGPSSAELRGQVMIAKMIQDRRFQGTGIHSNSEIHGTWLDKFCPLNESCRKFLKLALAAKNLSARSYDRILRVARTIADLSGHADILESDLAESCQYRVLDQSANPDHQY